MERNLTDGAVEGKGGWQYPASITKSGMMIRKDMPRDNSCLVYQSLPSLPSFASFMGLHMLCCYGCV
jgi:hypothetical protein